MLKTWLLVLLPTAALAQQAAPASGPAWDGGVGVGNGVEAHVGYQRGPWRLQGRAVGKWWGAASGPGTGLFTNTNVRSRQLEAAVLAVYCQPLGRSQLYGGLGLGYLNGRELGDFRYATTESGFFGSTTYYYAYRSYQALGLPVEVGLQLPRFSNQSRFGLAFEGNFNPEKNMYCGMLTYWFGGFGRPVRTRP